MMQNVRCIYCKKEKKLNKEHAFPESLLDKRLLGTKHEWIIDKHVCVECNTFLGNELDGILVNASPIGFIQHQIESELGNRNRDQHTTFYNSQKFQSIHPVRLFFSDPIYNDLIVLHEQIPATSTVEGFFDSIRALVPQIVLVQHPCEQTLEQTVAEDCRKFNNPDSGEQIVTTTLQNNKEYYKFGNTFIFPPKTIETFKKEKQQKEFKNRFLKEVKNVQKSMWIICPQRHKFHSTAMSFYNSVNGVKTMIEQETFIEPELFTRHTKVIMDPKAFPKIGRAIAKIAFHCFLFHYSTFSGHEPIFNRIKRFIYNGSGNPAQFISEWRNYRSENITFASSDRCCHGICFYVQRNNIGCMIDLFVGLLSRPFSFRINLAGNTQSPNLRKDREEYIPFSVHPKSQRKRRILQADKIELIQKPRQEEGVLWLP